MTETVEGPWMGVVREALGDLKARVANIEVVSASMDAKLDELVAVRQRDIGARRSLIALASAAGAVFGYFSGFLPR